MTNLDVLRTLLGARLRSQLGYRTSFAFDVVNQVLEGVVAFVEIWVLLHNVPVLGGMTAPQVFVVFGIATLAFAAGDMIFGQLDSLDRYIRQGTLDTLLTRPLPLLVQLITADLQLRRLGRFFFGLAVYLMALVNAGVDWTPWRLALAVLAPLAGVGIFGALFLLAGCVPFWVLGGREAANSFTYGSRYVGSVPSSALLTPVRVFFTFVVPATLIAYAPAAALTGAPFPPFMGPVMAWLGLPVAALLWGIGLLAWRASIRRYSGAGG